MRLGLSGRTLLSFAIAVVLVEAGLHLTTGAGSMALDPFDRAAWGVQTLLIGMALIAGWEWLLPRG